MERTEAMLVRSVKGVCYVYICLQERVLVGGSQLGGDPEKDADPIGGQVFSCTGW